MSLYDNTNVVSITDDDCILSKEPRIRSSLWQPGDQGYLMVFASWCPHCQSKVPMWTNLADEHNTNPDTNFIIMSSDIEKDGPGLASEAGIMGIPTLFFVHTDGAMEKIPSGKAGPMTTDWSEKDLRSRIPAPGKTPKSSSLTKTTAKTPTSRTPAKTTSTAKTAASLPPVRAATKVSTTTKAREPARTVAGNKYR